MSESSILSVQWNKLGDITRKVNDAIIALKKYALLQSEVEKTQEFRLEKEELENAATHIAELTEALHALRGAGDNAGTGFPNNSAEALQKEVITPTVDFYPKIETINLAVANNKPLNEEQLELLDNIVTTLDHERSELFKKLRTARG